MLVESTCHDFASFLSLLSLFPLDEHPFIANMVTWVMVLPSSSVDKAIVYSVPSKRPSNLEKQAKNIDISYWP